MRGVLTERTIQGGVFLVLAGLFASAGSQSAPFWDLSAGIFATLGVGYGLAGVLEATTQQGELIPIRIKSRRD
ncbi:hypothetical protein [Candidatus Igneacidithiobacillus taiwanensis]|uniref:hypothetical protein n=1 Tax=Candidatus Igneacidithiobacillus taiwanensis TaxID=1945924 RepID=UPI0028965B1B|nr:hypothetical protein [Candidatus Igneacidithiobacillus taiwanensis]